MFDNDEVHVWCARTGSEVDAGVLSADEWARARRFRFARHRDRWVSARVLLRRALSAYSDLAPGDLRFEYEPHGKPVLAHRDAVRFNLSHSGDLVVCAVSPVREVGIDVEEIRAVDDMSAIFQSVCSAAEWTAWTSLDRAQQTQAFFDCWTVKECCAKAVGTGLSTDVQSIEALTTTAHPRVIACGARLWSVWSFAPAEGYAAAVAVALCSTRAAVPRIKVMPVESAIAVPHLPLHRYQ